MLCTGNVGDMKHEEKIDLGHGQIGGVRGSVGGGSYVWHER